MDPLRIAASAYNIQHIIDQYTRPLRAKIEALYREIYSWREANGRLEEENKKLKRELRLLKRSLEEE